MEPVNIPEEGAEDGAELRLVLIGVTGAGKSSSGNTILGERKFQAGFSATSVTRCCQLGTAELMFEESGSQMKRTVSVVDGPGFGDTDLTAEEVQIEISKCVSLSAPGPHAFLLVVPVGRYTEHQNQAFTQMAKIFGDEAIRDHTVVLFTRGDELEGTSIESFLRRTAPAALRDLVNRCGGRFHVFNNKDTRSSEQVRVLLEKVDHMVGQRGFYTNAMYQAAEAAIREEAESLMRRQLKKEQRACRRRARKRAADVGSTGDSQASRAELLGRGAGGSSHQERSRFRSQAALSPTVLDKIKAYVSAIATGLVIGVALGALTPLAAAGGAYLAGTAAGWVAGVTVEAAVGAVVTAASGKTAVLVGAAAGGLVGGMVGVAGADVADPLNGALETAKTVGVTGVAAVGVGAVVGGVMGVGAALGAGAAAGTGATVVGVPGAVKGLHCAAQQCTAVPAHGPMGPTAPPADPVVPPVVDAPPAKSCLKKVADVTKSCLKSLPSSVSVKVHVKKEKPPEGPESETTTYEFSLNTKEQ